MEALWEVALSFVRDVAAAFLGAGLVALGIDWWTHRVRIDGVWTFVPKESDMGLPPGQRRQVDALFLDLHNRGGRRSVSARAVLTRSGEVITPLMDIEEAKSGSTQIAGWHLEPARQRGGLHPILSQEGATIMRDLNQSRHGGYQGDLVIEDQTGRKHRIRHASADT